MPMLFGASHKSTTAPRTFLIKMWYVPHSDCGFWIGSRIDVVQATLDFGFRIADFGLEEKSLKFH